jgi:uncharacterized membrane protein YukC
MWLQKGREKQTNNSIVLLTCENEAHLWMHIGFGLYNGSLVVCRVALLSKPTVLTLSIIETKPDLSHILLTTNTPTHDDTIRQLIKKMLELSRQRVQM